MAKTDFIKASPEAVEKFMAGVNKWGNHKVAPIGPECTVVDGGIELYGGNRGQREDLARIIARYDRNNIPATIKQVLFLEGLVDHDPGMASTVGVPDDLDTLTKTRASDLIDKMLNG